jgi:plastocyanin
MRLKRMLPLSVLLFAILAGGCSKSEETAGTGGGPVWKPAGNEGNINGAISFAGEAPAAKKQDASSDSSCGEVVLDDVIANGGKLQNVFVYVKSGLPEANFAVPEVAVSLDQKGCRFSPRVIGVQAGQLVSVSNSDPTNHNVHPIPRVNKEWNESQLAGQGPIKRKFTKPETMIQVKCNQHAWMTAWIGVLSHPFYAVSDANGSFAILGVPPGEYEIEAWHEKFGAKTMKVKVEPKGEARADFAFSPAVAAAPGSLMMAPAMVIQ